MLSITISKYKPQPLCAGQVESGTFKFSNLTTVVTLLLDFILLKGMLLAIAKLTYRLSLAVLGKVGTFNSLGWFYWILRFLLTWWT